MIRLKIGRGLVLPAWLALALLIPGVALAQSWSSGKGTGNVSMSFQMTKVRYHLFSGDVRIIGGLPGGRLDMGRVTGGGTNISANYALLQNLNLSASVAYVGGIYKGKLPESATLDDGKFHGSMQDASIGLSYALPVSDLVLVPMMSYSFPVTNYDHHGHVAVGNHTKSLALGASLGRSFAPMLPNGYAQVSYARNFTENLSIWGLDANTFAASVGYFVFPQLSVRGYFSYFEVGDGVDWYYTDFSQNQAEHFHDAAAKALVRRAGGALSYQWKPSTGFFVDIGGVLSGVNTHDGKSYSVGTTYNFTTPFAH